MLLLRLKNKIHGFRVKSGLVILLFLIFLPALSSAKTLTFQDNTWEVPAETIHIVNTESVRNDFDLKDIATNSLIGSVPNSKQKILDSETVTKLSEITLTVNQNAQDAKLVIENNHAQKFIPPQNRQALDLYELYQLLVSSESKINLPVIISEPKIKLSETNNLGINELVAVGKSDFTGSPNNRVHNIKIGAQKFNGIILGQNEEFSFNNYLGEVDGEHGFLPELVIKPQGVTPEFGGGLCQVSTITFRAAMNAGLPITARRNHSFAVKYYSPQGTDATIYPGASDLKFMNNLPSPVLIRTRIEGNELYFEFYGTKDSRVVTFDGPVQYDKKPDGSMKATWTRHVTLNEQTADQTFQSKYLPPALFQPKPVETSTPEPNPEVTQPQ